MFTAIRNLYQRLTSSRSIGEYGQNHLENPDNPLDDAWYDAFAGGYRSQAGERVVAQTLMRIPAFWCGVDLLSGDVAKIPLEFSEGTRKQSEAQYDSDLYRLVAEQPNEDQSAFEFWRQIMVCRLVFSNAYSWIRRNGAGEPIGLHPLLPDRTGCKRVSNGQKIYQAEVEGQTRYFDSYDILHFRGMTFDHDQDAISMVYYMRDTIGKILARERFASKFFARGGRLGGILQIPFSNNREKKQKIEQGFRQAYEGVDNAFKVVVLRENTKFEPAQATFRETQMIEADKQDTKKIARMLKVPPHKIGDDSKSAHNSLEQENRSYVQSSLASHLCTIAAECNLKLRSKDQRRSHIFKHDLGEFIQMDEKSKTEIAMRRVAGGLATRNEGREYLGMKPSDDPEADKLLVPAGMMPMDKMKTDDTNNLNPVPDEEE